MKRQRQSRAPITFGAIILVALFAAPTWSNHKAAAPKLRVADSSMNAERSADEPSRSCAVWKRPTGHPGKTTAIRRVVKVPCRAQTRS